MYKKRCGPGQNSESHRENNTLGYYSDSHQTHQILHDLLAELFCLHGLAEHLLITGHRKLGHPANSLQSIELIY
ncbi:unnamed protein product [Rhizopus microsporus]